MADFYVYVTPEQSKDLQEAFFAASPEHFWSGEARKRTVCNTTARFLFIEKDRGMTFLGKRELNPRGITGLMTNLEYANGCDVPAKSFKEAMAHFGSMIKPPPIKLSTIMRKPCPD